MQHINCDDTACDQWEVIARELARDNEELRKQVALIPKLERACSRKDKQRHEAAKVMMEAIKERDQAIDQFRLDILNYLTTFDDSIGAYAVRENIIQFVMRYWR